jgi:hypothetical protein
MDYAVRGAKKGPDQFTIHYSLPLPPGTRHLLIRVPH